MEKLDSLPVVWLIGEGLLIEIIATSLEEQSNLHLVRREKPNSTFFQEAILFKPAMIIFEIDDPVRYELLDLVKRCPEIQMLGIDRDCGLALVVSSFRI